jgi:hypothetical protein
MSESAPKPRRSFRVDDQAVNPGHFTLRTETERPRDDRVNPPPRFRWVEFTVPAETLFDAAVAAFRAEGIVVESLDRGARLLRGAEEMGAGFTAAVGASVAEASRGNCRILLSYDRPVGAPMDPESDRRRLERLLGTFEAELDRIVG